MILKPVAKIVCKKYASFTLADALLGIFLVWRQAVVKLSMTCCRVCDVTAEREGQDSMSQLADLYTQVVNQRATCGPMQPDDEEDAELGQLLRFYIKDLQNLWVKIIIILFFYSTDSHKKKLYIINETYNKCININYIN